MGGHTTWLLPLFFSTFSKDTDFKIQRIGIIQTMVMQALTKQYIILFLNNSNLRLQTVTMQHINISLLDDKKVPCSEPVIIILPSLKIPLVSVL